MARPDKIDAVKDIARRFSEADAALLTEYRGLRVAEIAEVRNALREAGSEYKVLKNTLARIAVREIGLEDLVDQLTGPTAIAFVKGDVAAAAKALDDASKRFPVLVIKGGALEGRILDADAARGLARLESREVLLTKIAMLANAPAQQAVNVLAALLRDLGSMLAQVVTKKEPGELPAVDEAERIEAEAEAPAAEESPEPGSAAEESSAPASQETADVPTESEAAAGGQQEEEE